MKIGDLVKVVAPESLTGFAAGKIGLITKLFDGACDFDFVVSIFDDSDGPIEVFLRQKEIKILSKQSNQD